MISLVFGTGFVLIIGVSETEKNELRFVCMNKKVVVIIAILLAVTFAAISIHDKAKLNEMKAQLAELQAQKAQLSEESELQSEFLAQYSETINEVYENLARIRQREGFLKRSADNVEENKLPMKAQLLADIESIDNYLQASKAKLAQLQKKYRRALAENEAFAKTVKDLQEMVHEREQIIAELKANFDSLNVQYVQTSQQLEETTTRLVENQRRLNTVYYIVASEKELKQKGIIEEKGGIFGIRKVKRLAANFQTDAFVASEKSSLGELTIDRKIDDVKVISPHNPNSYQLVANPDGRTTLEIVDPEEFWKIRYLVISAKS